jgi:hypothetical protein
MTVRVAHLKVSSVPDSDDTSLVRPSDWNEDHVVEGLGTAAEADTGDFATAAQGALADTAVQPAAIANMLETSDIGVTVQGYDADLAAWAGVNPSSYSTTAQIAAAYQPLDSDLTSWAGVTRASGFDTFAATPSSANLRSALTDETGTGSAVFGTEPVITVTATGASAARALAGRFAFKLQAEDFGCVGDDSTNNTSAITAAVAAFGSRGGVLEFGVGIYRLTAVTVNKPIIFQGQGHEATVLKSTTLTGDVLTMSSPGACAKDIRFDATGNRTSGAYIAASTVYQTHFERLYFTKYYRGITFDGCVSCSISKSDFRDGTPEATSSGSAGIVLLGTQCVDNRIDCVTMDAAAGSQPGHGIWLLNSDACQISNTDIIHHGYCLDMTPGNSQSVAATYVANSYFDNAGMGIRLLTSGTGTIPRASFVGVWSSSHSSNGAEITASGGAITAISFIGCQMLLNTSRGILVNGGTGIRIIGGHYNSNTVDGIAFGSGVSEFCVQGVQAISNGAQGIWIVGSNDNYQIIGNDLRSNSGEALLGHQGNTSTRITHSNLGIPEVALTRQIVTVQGSDVSLTNNITTAQSVFASANDAITLLASTTYRFRARLMIATGTTTHTTAFGFGGTATFTNIHYRSLLWSGTSGTINTTAPSKLDVSAATATVLNATSGAAFTEIEIEGVMRVNGAGTVIPQITFSAGPTGTCAVKVNSFIEFEPIGSNTVAAVARAA